MANSQAMATSFKGEVLNGFHQFGSPTIVSRTSLTTPTADTFKGCLLFVSGSAGASSTTYASVSASEVGNSGSYTAGGITMGSWNAPTTSSTEGYTTPTSSWTTGAGFSATAFDSLFIYNATQGNKAVGNFTFGSQTISSGTFTLTMPVNSNGTALVRFT